MIKASKQAHNFYVILSLLIVTTVGFLFKFYRGWGQGFFNDGAATICYEIMWCVFAYWFIRTRQAVRWIPLWVFIVTCILEFLQLWHPPFLQQIRANLLGRLLLGSVFVWSDFFYYGLGSFCGWLWLKQVDRLK